jgi:hypothetical protein
VRLILGMCDRWHKLPSEVRAEGAGIIRMLRIEELGTPPQDATPPLDDD